MVGFKEHRFARRTTRYVRLYITGKGPGWFGYLGLDELRMFDTAEQRFSAVYDAFGEQIEVTDATADHRHRFNGKERSELTRYLAYGYRSYDPLTMQWTAADPLYRFAPELAYDEPRRMNLYGFSLNNPLRYVDPDGRDASRASFANRVTIELLMVAANHGNSAAGQRAVELAQSAYGVSYANGSSPKYDPSMKIGAGLVPLARTRNGQVAIYGNAMAGKSADFLGSTVFHEGIHVAQVMALEAGGLPESGIDLQINGVMEVIAYEAQLAEANAGTFKLTDHEINSIHKVIESKKAGVTDKKATELMAQGDYEKALRYLANRRKKEMRRWIANAQAGFGDFLQWTERQRQW